MIIIQSIKLKYFFMFIIKKFIIKYLNLIEIKIL